VRRFVVVATQRSGTTFTARALSSMGLNCGHEAAFRWEGFVGWGDLNGDSSFFAAPFLQEVAADDPIVVHQVREPVSTIRALATSGVFMRLSLGRHVVMGTRRVLRGRPLMRRDEWFARRYGSAAYRERGEFARAARYWVLWNELIERETDRLGLETHLARVEDLAGDRLAAVGELLGGAMRAPAPVATTTNSVRSRFPQATLADLPSALRHEVVETATRYGYALTDPSETRPAPHARPSTPDRSQR
jgi:hypothetical protein